MVSVSTGSLRGRRILVTGGTGFVGIPTVRLMAALGAEVVVTYRTEPSVELETEHCEQKKLDVRESSKLREVMDGVDTVVHLAAFTGGIRAQQAPSIDVLYANQDASRSVFNAASAVGVRRVFIASSAVVYAASRYSAIPEDAPLCRADSGEISGYAWSKLSDELVGRWFMELGRFEVVIGRLTNVYGPGGSFEGSRTTVVHDLIRRAVLTRLGGDVEVWGNGSAVRSFIYRDDAAAAIIAILTRGASGGVYNIDTSEAVSIRDLAQLVVDAVDPRLNLAFDPEKPSGVPRRVLDNSKLIGLGFKPSTDLHAGVTHTVEHYRKAKGRS